MSSRGATPTTEGAGPPLALVDAFAERPFAGNPAGVCLLDGPAEAGWMQALAAELGQSETAFTHPSGDGRRALRWFTPAAEVELCGHATLAAAHALWESGGAPEDEPIVFDTLSGPLTARRAGSLVEMDFPATPAGAVEAPPELAAALGTPPHAVARSRFDYLAELATPAAVAELVPDLAAVARLPARGLVVTAGGGAAGADFTSRFFAPQTGIDEDPVTGSAHCALGPYWAARLGRDELVGHQASARGGLVRVAVRGERIRLAGAAVTTVSGRARIAPPA